MSPRSRLLSTAGRAAAQARTPARRTGYARALLAGGASGARSQAAVAACALTSPAVGSRMRVVAALAVFGELVVDKLPQTPSRVFPPALATRIAMGAASGAVVGRRAGASVSSGIALGVAGALLTSVIGVRVRDRLCAELGSDLPGALVEDGLALTAAAIAARR